MNDFEKGCKKKGCNNPVLDGKYCEYCKQSRKEKRDKFFKGAVGIGAGVGSLVLAVIFKKPPNIHNK